MNEKLKIEHFSNQDFGSVRVVDVCGKPMFVANDIAKALGYAIPKDAIKQHCRKGVKHLLPCKSGSYTNREGLIVEIVKDVNTVIIPESDVYRLIMRSNLPSAERFQDWVCEEVIPSVREHGVYISPEASTEDIKWAIENGVIAAIKQGKVRYGEMLDKMVEIKDCHALLCKESYFYIYENLPSKFRGDFNTRFKRSFLRSLDRLKQRTDAEGIEKFETAFIHKNDVLFAIEREHHKHDNKKYGQKIRRIKNYR